MGTCLRLWSWWKIKYISLYLTMLQLISISSCPVIVLLRLENLALPSLCFPLGFSHLTIWGKTTFFISSYNRNNFLRHNWFKKKKKLKYPCCISRKMMTSEVTKRNVILGFLHLISWPWFGKKVFSISWKFSITILYRKKFLFPWNWRELKTKQCFKFWVLFF